MTIETVAAFRPAVREDADRVLGLWRSSGAAPSVSDDIASIQRLVEHDPGAMLLAEVDGALVGSVIAAWDGWRGGIYRLAVMPSWRRRGVGRTLVAVAEDRLHALGAPKVCAIVLDDHDHAVAFWRGVGYERDRLVSRYTRSFA